MNTYKKHQVVMLPTNEKAVNISPIVLYNNKLFSCYSYLYFLSDEEIKEGDWCIMLDSFGNVFSNPQQYLGEEKGHYLNKGHKKIIATTDVNITSDYSTPGTTFVPEPSPDFIKVYVDAYNAGTPIEWVDVEYEEIVNNDVVFEDGSFNKPYKTGKHKLKVNSKNEITIKLNQNEL